MPEIWIPYGGVETLVTIQAENLGAIAEPAPEATATETERMSELAKGASQIFICDAAPTTMEFLRGIVPAMGENQGLKLVSPAPKRVELGVPELKGKVLTLPPPLSAGEGDEPLYAPELMEKGTKLFVGSARPDPMFGLLDAKAEACLNWVTRSRTISAEAREGMEPEPFHKSVAYEALESLAERVPESKFLTIVSRGGKLKTVMEDAPFDAIRNAFPKIQMSQARGLVLGAGGRGYDDTFSSALRGVWSALEGVRKAGSVLVIAECSEGVGSSALELLVTGRLAEGGRRRERYVEGLEEVFYLNKLKEEYDILLLSGLPETYSRTKLGLTTAKGSGEAVGRLLNKVGRSGKLNVVPRAPECLVESG